MIPTYSTTLSPTFPPSIGSDFSASRFAGLFATARSSILLARVRKSEFFATKSVSLFRTIIAPAFPSPDAFERTTPSDASLSARLLATACPFLRIISIALSKLPSLSSRAFLQSIIPARVTLLSFATSAAFIVAIIISVLKSNSVIYLSLPALQQLLQLRHRNHLYRNHHNFLLHLLRQELR